MKIGYLFPIAIIVIAIAFFSWFIASGAWQPGSQ